MSRLSTLAKLLPVLRVAYDCASRSNQWVASDDYNRGYANALRDVLSLIETGEPRGGLWYHSRRIARSLRALRSQSRRKPVSLVDLSPNAHRIASKTCGRNG